MHTGEPLRIGIVGIGFGQNVLLPGFRTDPRVTVTAICASRLDRAQTVAARAGVPHAFGDWRALIASAEVDAVAIAVPPVLQPDIASAAIEHGKPVFCEKPVALEHARAQALLAQAEAAGVAHAVDFEFAELASWRRAREILAGGELGQIRSFALNWHVLTRAHQPGVVSWKQRTADGGGALSSFASHTLHAIEWLLGPMAGVKAHLAPAGAPSDARVAVLVALASGASGTISVATDAVAGAGHRLEIYGSDASLLLENGSPDHFRNFVLSRGVASGERTIIVDERKPGTGDGRIEPVAALVRRFVDAVFGGPAVRPGLAEGVRVAALMEAIRSSDRSGAWSKV